MSPGIKALLVVFGTMAFFLIPVFGPGASTAGDFLVQRALGVDDESAVMERKMPTYESTPALKSALECCTAKCSLDWNWYQDRCTLDTRADAGCYEACGEVPSGEVAPTIEIPKEFKYYYGDPE